VGLVGDEKELAMAKAVVDPEELRRFAVALKRFTTGVNQQMSQLHAMMGQLAETWRDQEHAKFAAEFEQTLRALARFTDVADQQAPMLMKKADRIDDYLNQR
jgi:uncharacterized protein YukE